MRLNLATIILTLAVANGAFAAPLPAPKPVPTPGGNGLIALIKMLPKTIPTIAKNSSQSVIDFFNHPKTTALIGAGNTAALYYWLTNELDRKDQLQALRAKTEAAEAGSTLIKTKSDITQPNSNSKPDVGQADGTDSPQVTQEQKISDDVAVPDEAATSGNNPDSSVDKPSSVSGMEVNGASMGVFSSGDTSKIKKIPESILDFD